MMLYTGWLPCNPNVYDVIPSLSNTFLVLHSESLVHPQESNLNFSCLEGVSSRNHAESWPVQLGTLLTGSLRLLA